MTRYLAVTAVALGLCSCAHPAGEADDPMADCPHASVPSKLTVIRAPLPAADSAGVTVVVRHYYPGNPPGDSLDAIAIELRRGSVALSVAPLSRGLFWFPFSEAGTYAIAVKRLGYRQLADTVTMRAGFRDTLIVGLMPRVMCLR